MSLECQDNWCHILTSFLVEKDVKILWKCHDILMEFNRIFMRKRHPRQMPWECHEIPMSFNGVENSASFWWYFMGKVHGIVMEFDVIFDQNSIGNQWWHLIMRAHYLRLRRTCTCISIKKCKVSPYSSYVLRILRKTWHPYTVHDYVRNLFINVSNFPPEPTRYA